MTTALLLIGVFLLSVTIGIPLAFGLILASAVVILWEGLPTLLVAQQSFIMVDSYALMAIPFFVLAGELMSVGGLTQGIIGFTNALIGHVRGGLAQVNVLGSALFSGLSASSVADTAAIGSVVVPAMLKEGYSRGFTVAVTCASGALGAILPPSLFMIVYGSITGVSITNLFLGGIIPGILITTAQMALCYYYSFYGEGGIWPRPRATMKVVGKTFIMAVPALMLPVIIIAGIVFGAFTATEAGIVAVVYAVLYGFVSRTLTTSNIGGVFSTAIFRTSQVMLMTAAAGAFSWLLARSNAAPLVADLLMSVTDNPLIVLILIVLVVTVISTFLDALPATLILTPVFYPLGLALGFDPVHFAIVLIVTIVMGGITPPVAPLLFVASAIAGGNPLEAMRAILAFLLVTYVVIILMVLFPSIVTYLPNLVGT